MKHTSFPLNHCAALLCLILLPALTPLLADTSDDLNEILGPSVASVPTAEGSSAVAIPDDIRRCIDLSASLAADPTFQARAQFALVRTLSKSGFHAIAVDVARSISNFQSAQALGVLSVSEAEQGHSTEALALLKESRSAAETLLGWKRDRALTEIAVARAILGDMDAAASTVEEITDEHDRIRAKSRVAAALARRTGFPAFELIRVPGIAENYLQEADYQCRPFVSAADHWIENNDPDRAKTLLLEAADIAMSANTNTQIAPVVEICETLTGLGFEEDAERLFASAVTTAERLGDGATWKSEVFAGLAVAMHRSGRSEEAAQFLGRASAFPDTQPLMNQPEACVRIAEAWHQLGDAKQAAEWWMKAALKARTNPNSLIRAHGAFLVALSHVSLGHPVPDDLAELLNTLE